jgi:hypothetical protein
MPSGGVINIAPDLSNFLGGIFGHPSEYAAEAAASEYQSQTIAQVTAQAQEAQQQTLKFGIMVTAGVAILFLVFKFIW